MIIRNETPVIVAPTATPTAIPNSGLSSEHLRQAVSPTPVSASGLGDDGRSDEQLVAASVLVPIVQREEGFSVLLTQRTEHLRDHPGQISFPGGRAEPEDRSPVSTALREAAEEVGLMPNHVDVIGYLPNYHTITGYRVTPVVAFVKPPFELKPDAFEVALTFEAPLAFLMNSANHREFVVLREGRSRKFFAIPYGKQFIWGATAGMILSLYRALAA